MIENLSRKNKIWIGIALSLVVMQLARIDKSVPTVSPKDTFHAIYSSPVNDPILLDIKNACYDCHSYQTKYPWYAEVAPLSLWLKGHVDNGRDKLNFDIWNSYSDKRKNHKLEECIESLEDSWMPLKSYTWLHSDAKLSPESKDRLITFFKSL